MSTRLHAILSIAIAFALGASGTIAAIATGPGVAAAATTPTYYVALGDSLAAGTGANPGSNAYVNRVYTHEAARFPGLTLSNLSCGGATTGSMLTGSNCGRSVTQIVDAENFLRAHRGQVQFVTIDIGGNDVSGCVGPSGVDATCSSNAAAAIQSNLTTILSRLKAASPGIRVFGMSYYIPSLAYWFQGASGQQIARDSVTAAASFNQQLTQIYSAAGFPTADVAGAFDNNNFALTGTYNAVTVPQNVANACNWTYACTNADVHANNTGHGKLADAFAAKIDATAFTPVITTATLPAAHRGTAYAATLTATGGTPAYKWKKIGKLPKGLKITPKTGVISGTPTTKAATATFQVQVRDSSKPKQTATKTFTISVS